MSTFLQKKNNAKSTLTASVAVIDTSITVSDGSKFPSSGSFRITVWDKVSYPDPGDDPGMEIMTCTSRSGNVLTVTRGVEFTSAATHDILDTVGALITAGMLQEYESSFLELDGSESMTAPIPFTSALNGQSLFTIPSAIGTGVGTSYSFPMGGGSDAGVSMYNYFTFGFDDIDTSSVDDSANILTFNLGKTNKFGTPNQFIIESDSTAAHGLIQLITDMQYSIVDPKVGYRLVSTGIVPLRFLFDNSSTPAGANNAAAYKTMEFRFDGTSFLTFDYTKNASRTAFGILDQPAITTNGSNVSRFRIENTNTITHSTGNELIWATLWLEEMNITNSGGTIPDTAVLYIPTAATEGTRNYGLFVDAGLNRFDGGIILGGATGVNLSASTGGVLTLAGSGNTNNENLTLDFEGTANRVTLNTGTGVTDVSFSIGIRAASTLELVAKAGTTTDGHVWNDTTQKALQTYVDGIEQTLLGCIFTQTASATVANTVTETAITSTGVGTLTLPANFFVAGKTIRINAMGHHSTTGSPTIRLRVKLGSTTILDTTAVNSHASTNEGFEVIGLITCRTTGATGTVFGQGNYVEFHTSGAHAGMVNTGTTTIDTTASQAISITVEWGTADAGNTITATHVTAEVLN